MTARQSNIGGSVGQGPWTVATLVVLSLGASAQSDVRTFSIPDTRAAGALAERAQDHLDARRWHEALADLQRLLEEHPNDLLGAERPRAQGRPSQQDVHRGAAEWALAELEGLEGEARELYRDQHGRDADAALERARERGDPRALAALAERWPLTDAALAACWTLGDAELELGHPDQACLAWGRALRRVLELPAAPQTAPEWASAREALARGGASAGVLSRTDFALTLLERGAGDPDATTRELRLPGPGEAAHGTPGFEASSWPRPFRLPSTHAFRQARANLHPVRAGETILVSTSMSLLAIDAFSGSLRWTSGEAAGWESLELNDRLEFFKGIDKAGALIAPAASQAVAVAALQVPITQISNQRFNHIPILTIIPDRRLFAFDVETGRELWNHAPRAGWDGEQGGFAERMRVAGPPVIAASRVLVPTYRMQGRIDYHVACYALETGELIWSTQLVSGQRELNMFNRHSQAFSAAPLRVEGERVIALTQLGTVASLDLFTGRVHWETLYDQNPLPPRRNHNAPRRTQSWRNAPPVVADGVVVATPVDSDDLIGIDIESGSLLWSVRQSKISDWGRGMRTDVNLLLGADETTVYLGGRRLLALACSAGLRHEAPHTLAWRFTDPLLADEQFPAWPLLLDDRIVVPTTTERIEIHRQTGRRLLRAAPWGPGGGGNLLVGEGTLFTLNSRFLTGYFEWDMLLSRASEAHERAPEELTPALNLAALMGERGRIEAFAGNTPAARVWLDDAAHILTPFLTDDTSQAEARVLAELHGILRSKARVLADLADTRGALSALRAARAMSPDIHSERDTLLEQSILLRSLEDNARMAVLTELEAACGSLFVHGEVVAEQTPAQVLMPDTFAGTNDGSWRIEPLLDRSAEDELLVWTLPVGLWVSLERAAHLASSGDVAGELVELHHMLQHWPEVPLPPGSVTEVAGGRIAARVDAFGLEIYAPFEDRAHALLERATGGRDRERLEEVARLFPHSQAARDANDLLLDWAVEEQDAPTVARIVLSELPRVWSAAHADEREALLALRLGATLESGGNRDTMRELTRALARAQPDLVSPIKAHGGLTLRELVEREPRFAHPTALASRTFHGSPPVRSSYDGRHTLLGAMPPAPDAQEDEPEVLLFARGEPTRRGNARSVSISAVSAANPQVPLWSQHVAMRSIPVNNWEQRVAFAPGIVLLALDEGVIALGRDGDGDGGGEWLWGWTAPEGVAEAVEVHSGLALVVSDLPGSMSLIHALDTATGMVVWEREISETLHWPHAICGEREVVFLPRVGKRTALVLDLFTGRWTREFDLPHALRKEAYATSWIEAGRLILPRFMMLRRPEQNQIVALQLETGTIDWTVRFEEVAGGGRELHAIVQHAERTYLVLRPRHTLREDDAHGLLVELNTSVGGHAAVGNLRLGIEHQLIGVGVRERTRIDSPFLFLRSFGPDELEMKVHAVHLPYGHERWVRRLPVSSADLYDRDMPMPAVSQTTVALAYSEKPRNTRQPARTILYSFDKSTGTPSGNQILDLRLGRGDQLELTALGDALLLAGEEQLQVMR
jgi:outer membrane protein assembly factor BamB/tetratricopeptide (TPR) repeat protein